MIAAPADTHGGNGPENIFSHCGATSSPFYRLLGQIDKSVQPIGSQRDALAGLKEAIDGAGKDLTALCMAPVPLTAVSRLETIEARLDATWRAVSSTQAALADFEAKLSDEQKNRLDTMNFTAAGKS